MDWIKSFKAAWSGLKTAVAEERNMKFHFIVMILVVALGFYFQIDSLEWIALWIVIGLVISIELVNTAIENLMDFISKERHPIAGKVKDISAAAVLISALISIGVGFAIFLKYFKNYWDNL
jgi:diacylglycerol kinase